MAILKNTTIDDTGFVKLPVGNDSQRTASEDGKIRYNSTTNVIENYITESSAWMPAETKNIRATGGDVVYDTFIDGTSYRVHLFTTTGNSNFTVSHPGEIDYLIVAGGGAGSKAHNTNTCGGGGGGGVVTGSMSLGINTYSITVGAGGTCNTAAGNRTGTNGANSTAFGLTAIGGGRGGDGANVSANGADGGSGGGAGSYSASVTRAHTGGSATQNSAGSPGFGNNGGSHSGTSGNGGCGGGGAGSVGQNDGVGSAVGNGTNGGSGIGSSITGIRTMYAAGGGSSPWQDNVPGLGGAGGGGNGGGNSQNATNGVPSTGGGGGASKSGTIAGNGGSGIVVVRYPLQSTADSSATKMTNKNLVFDIDFSNPNCYTGAGSIVNDSNLNTVNGRAVGTPTFAQPRTQRSHLRFNGSTQHVGLGRSFCDNQELGTGNVSYTQEAWFRLNNTPPGDTTSGYSIFGNASAVGIGMQAILVGGNIRLNFGARSTSNFENGTNLSLNTWYHVACVREAGVQNRIYINGQLDGTLGGSSLTILAGAGEMQIAWSNTRVNNRLNGDVAMARLYNTWLTSEEVLNNFNATRWRFGV